MEYSQKDIKKIFQTLPEELQEAILSLDYNDITDEISKKYTLHIDQKANLIDETRDVLFGITDPMAFVDNVTKKLNIDRNTAAQIVVEVNQKIFVPVKDALRQIHGGKPQAPIAPASQPQNVIKKVETETLNVPKKTLDILQGTAPAAPRKVDTSILGFQAPAKTTASELDLLDQKMKGATLPKVETEISQAPRKATDPYREGF